MKIKSLKSLLYAFLLVTILYSCKEQVIEQPLTQEYPDAPYITVLGVAQDAGYPQADCKKKCCTAVWNGQQTKRKVSCIALVDPASDQFWIFDATPDFREQLNDIQHQATKLSGIFLTHAHMGHYTGLMHLGREAMGAKEVSVFAMPRMKSYLANNGPWSQLVDLKNISLQSLKADSVIQLTEQIQITPLAVPHRDEFSETVGFKITFDDKSALFIPDIDKWKKWNRSIKELIEEVDVAYLDGTFYANGELPGRDMSEIPHPFVAESMELFKDLSKEEKSKVHFIHFNHTNDLLRKGSTAQKEVLEKGFNFAKEGEVIKLK